MLKPHRHHSEFLPLAHESSLPAVYGKPWFWERRSSSMESTRSLAQVIMEMRDEIKKLETENRVLREEFESGGHHHHHHPAAAQANPAVAVLSPVVGAEQQRGAAGGACSPENPYYSFNLRRNASAPVLDAGQYKDNAVMTVRRYSISSNLSEMDLTDRGMRRGGDSSGWGRLQHEVHSGSGGASMYANTARGNGAAAIIYANTARGKIQRQEMGGKNANRHSLQEYVLKNRAKVKTVTFLLPVDDIYTNRPVLTRQHQEDLETSGPDSISETES